MLHRCAHYTINSNNSTVSTVTKIRQVKRQANKIYIYIRNGLKIKLNDSLVVQWLRTHPAMQGTQFQSLILEDSRCLGAPKPVGHNYWVSSLEPTSHSHWAQMLQPLKSGAWTLCFRRSHHSEKPKHQEEK